MIFFLYFTSIIIGYWGNHCILGTKIPQIFHYHNNLFIATMLFDLQMLLIFPHVKTDPISLHKMSANQWPQSLNGPPY